MSSFDLTTRQFDDGVIHVGERPRNWFDPGPTRPDQGWRWQRVVEQIQLGPDDEADQIHTQLPRTAQARTE